MAGSSKPPPAGNEGANALDRPLLSTDLGPLVRTRNDVTPHMVEDHPGGGAASYSTVLVGTLSIYATVFALAGVIPAVWIAISAPVCVLSLSARTLLRRLQLRRLRRIAPWHPGQPSSAYRARVVGRIEPAASILAATGSRTPSVYCRVIYYEARSNGKPSHVMREDVRGVPFHVRLETGEALRIDPAAIHLLESPTRLEREVDPLVLRALGAATRGRGARMYETTLAPGDRIEAIGRIVREVSPSGTSGPGCGTAMVSTLEPADGGRILIWRAPPPAR